MMQGISSACNEALRLLHWLGVGRPGHDRLLGVDIRTDGRLSTWTAVGVPIRHGAFGGGL
jgi:hypothetical protein